MRKIAFSSCSLAVCEEILFCRRSIDLQRNFAEDLVLSEIDG